MFRVVSDWLYSLSVVFGCDANTKVFVLSKLFSTKPERYRVLLYQPKIVATQSSWLQLVPVIAMQQVVHIERHHTNDS